jgi:hypothetical protein
MVNQNLIDSHEVVNTESDNLFWPVYCRLGLCDGAHVAFTAAWLKAAGFSGSREFLVCLHTIGALYIVDGIPCLDVPLASWAKLTSEPHAMLTAMGEVLPDHISYRGGTC